MSAREIGEPLASSTARGKGAQLAWSISGLSMILLAWLIGQALRRADLATFQFPQTVVWCLVPYLVAAHLLYRGSALPAAERRSLLVVTTTIPFLLTPLGFALLQRPYSRGAVLLVFVLSTGWFLLGDLRRQRAGPQRLLYLDEGVPQRLAALLNGRPHPSEVVRLVPCADESRLDEQLPALGVVLERGAAPSEARNRLISAVKQRHVRLYDVEGVAQILGGRVLLRGASDELWQVDGNPAYDLMKRCLDALLVLATLPAWLPLLLLAALAARLDSPGPAFFVQERVGQHGRLFRLWKIRSMRHAPVDAAARFASVGDARVTRVGAFLRRTRLDELPQLWNVLKGEMSLVGPRPEQEPLAEGFARRLSCYPYRHLIRPGLTGWAQIQQGYAGSEEETELKLSYDLYYVAHYSLAMDLLILFKTLRIVVSGFGAR